MRSKGRLAPSCSIPGNGRVCGRGFTGVLGLAFGAAFLIVFLGAFFFAITDSPSCGSLPMCPTATALLRGLLAARRRQLSECPRQP